MTSSESRPFRVGLLGHGTVGSAFERLLEARAGQVELADPRVGDVVVTPATGAYGYAMANNYNGVPRAPVVFCSGRDARVVVRRETFEDLHARDV